MSRFQGAGFLTFDKNRRAHSPSVCCGQNSDLDILFAFIALECFAHDGLDQGHFCIRQLGELALTLPLQFWVDIDLA